MRKYILFILAFCVITIVYIQNQESDAPQVMSFSKIVIQETNLNEKISSIKIEQSILKKTTIRIKLNDIPNDFSDQLIKNGFSQKGNLYLFNKYGVIIEQNELKLYAL